jgi:myosin-7
VFYELVQGSSPEEKEKYLIDDDIESYFYLNQSGCIDIGDVDDVKNFETLKLALSVMNLATQDLDAVFKV